MLPGRGCHQPQPGAALLTPCYEPTAQGEGRSGSDPPALAITELSRLEMTFKVTYSDHRADLPHPTTKPHPLETFHPLPQPRQPAEILVLPLRGGVTRSLPAFPSSLLPSRMRWDGMETIQRKQQGEGWTAPAHRQHLGSPCSPLSVQGPGTSSPPGPDPGGASGLLPSHPAPEEALVPLAGNAAAEQTLPVPPLNYLMSYRSR